ncbi:MAG TPA: thioredoxin domain-containing protein [Solirubrobacterales bacterium]|nr:thioredoxin domain-containing protein [Solirubrobacterales bacterium]
MSGERSQAEQERRQRVVQLGSAAAFLAIVVVAVLIVIGQSQTDGGDTSLEGADVVRQELAGIPQDELVLGDPGARVTLVEFGDLQCPVCKGYAEEVIPDVIDSKVRGGEARIEFRNFTIISEESVPAAAAAIAAGKQGRGWNFVELFYRNQGIERSGYVTDEFLTEIARGAGVPDIAKWDTDRKSRRVLSAVSADTTEAEQLGLGGTPSFAVEGPGTKGLEPLGTLGSAGEIEAAIEAALG